MGTNSNKCAKILAEDENILQNSKVEINEFDIDISGTIQCREKEIEEKVHVQFTSLLVSILLLQKHCEIKKKLRGKKKLRKTNGVCFKANWSRTNRVFNTIVSYLICADFDDFQTSCPTTLSHASQSD